VSLRFPPAAEVAGSAVMAARDRRAQPTATSQARGLFEKYQF